MNAYSEKDNGVFWITLDRPQKHNAFDDTLISLLHKLYEEAIQDEGCKVIVLKANGKHFCAGADLEWMAKMASFNEEQNLADAKQLAKLLQCIYHCPKPTIAMVQGSAFGGGAGLVAASDIGIATDTSHFCFSEVKLGLIPAVISPYVVNAIGARNASWLFMSADSIDANHAKALQLIQYCVAESELISFTTLYAHKLTRLATEAIVLSKQLARQVAHQPIDEQLIEYTALAIAKKRASTEGRQGIQAFLNKQLPHWE